jgi:hypothetical protein
MKGLEKLVKNIIQTVKRKIEKKMKIAAGCNRNKRPFFAYVRQKTKRKTLCLLKDAQGRTVSDT